MSRGNVEIVKELFAAYERDPGAISPLVSPEIVWNPMEEQPTHGVDAVIEYMERWTGEWDEYSQEAEEFIDAGDSVVVTVHFKAAES
jgi:ketosteroid isomerase-like protein